MDSITPEVDGFCCTVAKKVNSLLFRNNWISFSLTWGAEWISLCTSRGQKGEAGWRGEVWKTGAWEEEENGVKSQVKLLRAQLASSSSSVKSFHFLAEFITLHSYIHSTKTGKCYLCHHAHWSLWQVTVGQTVVLWHKFWWDSEQFGLLKKIDWVAINKAGGCQVRGSWESENLRPGKTQG